jgi:alpha-glucosidase (family GH31 glycosyl hydrolase)
VTREANPERFAALAAAVGADPGADAVGFAIGNRTFADSLQRVVMGPLIAEGLDMAWTDFQQGFPGVGAVRGLLPTAMLNHHRFYNFSAVVGTRGTTHSRYAGRGDHRHASHFGGDVDQTWESLRFMIYFTATAANAPACWWGHEMMRAGSGVDDNAELFTRVNQFGAWSPIFTSWGNSGENNNWWEMREPHLSSTRGALLDRQRLLPYRYSAAAEAHRTGRCPIRSMYRDFPAEAAAYSADGQYMLGRDVVVAPAFSPVAPPLTGSVGVAVWLPPVAEGAWIDFNAPGAAPLPAGAHIIYNASLAVVPAFVRAGAVLPMLPRRLANVSGISAQQYRELEFNVFPGRGAGLADVYEDDGLTTDYLQGASATTRFAYAPAPSQPGCTVYSISTSGAYGGMVATGRLYSVFLLAAAAAPASVSVDGQPLPQAPADGAASSWFLTAAGDVHAFLPPASVANEQALTVCF